MELSQENLEELSQFSNNLIDTRTHDELLFLGSQLVMSGLLAIRRDSGLGAAREELYKIHHLMEAKLFKEAYKYRGDL